MLVRAAHSAEQQPMDVDGATGGAEDALLTLMYDVASGRNEQPVRCRLPVRRPWSCGCSHPGTAPACAPLPSGPVRGAG